MSFNKQSPIGIFDSGLGGLTVAKAVSELLPNEDIIYYGDTARVPYGIKSQQTIRSYSIEISRFLQAKGVKMIIIACNTASAAAYQGVRDTVEGLPVLNVIDAGTLAAVQTGKKQIGVIGTLGTIASGAYDRSLKEADNQITVKSKACPLLVPLAEEGWTDNHIARETIEIYLQPFRNNGAEALILGCTHYPLFKQTILEYFTDKPIEIIDSAVSVAEMAKNSLSESDLLYEKKKMGELTCYVSDRPQRFQELAERFIGREIDIKTAK